MEESLGLSLVRSSRVSAKVSPQSDEFEGYIGERDGLGRPHGNGTLTISDGSLLWLGGAYGADSDGIGNGIYEGEFKHGKRHGVGTFSFADGRTFQGEWEDNMIVHGKMQYVNGDLFDGRWKNGVKDNRGMYRLANGETYDGYWKNNEKHGIGVTKIPGKVSKGWECWANDRIIEMVAGQDRYGGDIDSNKLPHGRGTTLHKSGEVYDGEYENGKRSGFGTLYHPVIVETGQLEVAYTGHWKNDLKHGEGLMREYQPAKCETPLNESDLNSKTRIVSEYKGYFVNGVKEGLGVEVDLRSGRWREGEWKNNEMCGHGQFFYPSNAKGGGGGVRYEGEWENGVFHGMGVLWDEDESVYRGEFKEGSRHGVRCDELYMDGSHYCGSFANNKREGEGTLLIKTDSADKNSNSYQGEWRNGRYHGKGVRLFPDGTRYEGEYAEGKPNGIGCMLYAPGKYVTKFDGRWESGQCRDGTESYADETEYRGEMLNGLRHGRGRMEWKSGDVYEGDWCEGVMHGQGKYTYSIIPQENDNTKKSDVYIGDWLMGKRHGKGSLAFGGGDVYDGTWVDDERTGEGEMLYADGRIFAGCFLKGKKSGKGIQTWPEGSRYNGEWKHDQMHGEGKYRYADGRKVEGMFQCGRPHGEAVGTTYDDRIYHKGQWEKGEPLKINSKGKKEKSIYRIPLPPVPMLQNDPVPK